VAAKVVGRAVDDLLEPARGDVGLRERKAGNEGWGLRSTLEPHGLGARGGGGRNLRRVGGAGRPSGHPEYEDDEGDRQQEGLKPGSPSEPSHVC
jgi:hypothetical protein